MLKRNKTDPYKSVSRLIAPPSKMAGDTKYNRSRQKKYTEAIISEEIVADDEEYDNRH